MKRLVAGQIAGLDPQQIFKRARNIVAFDHFGGTLHCRLEPGLCGFGVFGQANSDIHHIGPAGLGGVKPGAIAPDHAAPLQILHPAQTGTGRQAHPVGQVQIALLGVARQLAQYFVGNGVNIGHGLQDYCIHAAIGNFIYRLIAYCPIMDLTLLPALTLFAFVTSITPGPNNMMLLASGANFGLRRTVPHMLGVGIGFVLMMILIGLGLLQVFDRYPVSYDILRWGGLAYMLWLAVKIATQVPKVPEPNPQARPITFLQACAFQWVNPKAWSMAVNAITLYTAQQSLPGIALAAVVFGVVNIPSVALWAMLGQQMRRFLTSPARLRAFNIGMAVLLVLTLIPVLWH